MKWLIENWYLIVIAIVVAVFVVDRVLSWVKTDQTTKIDNVKEWLKFAVLEAEKNLGQKTGAVKLRMVYDMAVNKFPWIVDLVTFDMFSLWVDEALDWMKDQLDKNKAINDYVNGDQE